LTVKDVNDNGEKVSHFFERMEKKIMYGSNFSRKFIYFDMIHVQSNTFLKYLKTIVHGVEKRWKDFKRYKKNK